MAGTLQGKVALVTGASSGIGEATAYALAAQGACVAVSARRAERLDAVVKRIQDRGGQAISIVADIADEAQANDMVNRTVGRWGRLDILVNNAGVMLLGKIANANPEARRETEEWIRSITPLPGEDIANAIVYAVTQPQHVDINEMLIRPSQQAR